MAMEIDPSTVQLVAGRVLIHVVEVLGGMTRGGVFVPGSTQDHMGKDTVYGRVVRVGPAPTVRVSRDDRGVASIHQDKSPWPQEYRVVHEGHVVLFPRDVELAFVHGEDRYAIVNEHEAILSFGPADQFDRQGLEVVPWRPGQLP